MKLWLLEPVKDLGEDDPWNPWYDKCDGFVVRAESETQARELAAADHGDECRDAWLEAKYSTCTELTPAGAPGVILSSFNAA